MRDHTEPFMLYPETIIGIFDLDSSTESYTTREFLRNAEKSKRLISLSRDIPRSIVITDTAVYLSGISSKTLRSRMEARTFQNIINTETTKFS